MPSDKPNLARIRENQRRSRARRKEYLQELESRWRRCEQAGAEASAELQAAARKVAEENKRLRMLLKEHGLHESEVQAYLVKAGAHHDGPPLGSLLAMRKDCSSGCNRAPAMVPAPSKPALWIPIPTDSAVAPTQPSAVLSSVDRQESPSVASPQDSVSPDVIAHSVSEELSPCCYTQPASTAPLACQPLSAGYMGCQELPVSVPVPLASYPPVGHTATYFPQMTSYPISPTQSSPCCGGAANCDPPNVAMYGLAAGYGTQSVHPL